MVLVSGAPSLEFNLNDLLEGWVWLEFAVDLFKVELVVLEDFKESLEAELVPPSVVLHDGEHSSDDVTEVASTTIV